MNVQELRIGSLVMGFDGKPFEWTLQDFSILYNNKVDPNELCIPIPITEEWLVKFGFEVEQSIIRLDRKTYKKSGFKYYNSNDYFEYLGIPLAINYVHQLQNLHYELTWKELTLKGD